MAFDHSGGLFPIGNQGGSTGNGNGNNSTNPPIITNKLTDPCMAKILNETLNHNGNGIIKDILKNLGENTLVDLTFQNVPSIDDGADARIQATIIQNPNGTTLLSGNIYLNSSNLERASKEYITSVIIHESVHAYFRVKSGEQEPLKEMDHQKMSTDYVRPMTNFMIGMYGISATDASSLVWRGLMRSNAYTQSLTFSVQQDGQILSVPKIIIEQTGVNYLISNKGTFKCD